MSTRTRLAAGLLAIATFTGCAEPWQEVRRERVGAPVKVEESCSRYGYCYVPGHYDWMKDKQIPGKWGFSHECPGEHLVTYQRWRVHYKRLDKNAKSAEAPFELGTREHDEFIEATPCKKRS